MRDAAVTALLVAGVACGLLSCLGVLLMRDALDRLHYVGAGTPAVLFVAAAVLVRESASLAGNKAIALAAFTLIAAPVLAHVTARAIAETRREKDDR
jgi:multisubunit Na+/H+ antiporter MnhG subunit